MSDLRNPPELGIHRAAGEMMGLLCIVAALLTGIAVVWTAIGKVM